MDELAQMAMDILKEKNRKLEAEATVLQKALRNMAGHLVDTEEEIDALVVRYIAEARSEAERRS